MRKKQQNVIYTASISLGLILSLVIFFQAEAVQAGFVMQSKTTVEVELTGYDGLKEQHLFKGTLAAGAEKEISTLYHGLALLKFVGGQQYPLLIGAQSFTVAFTDPADRPVFTGSSENDFFYKALTGKLEHEYAKESATYPFAVLLLQGKDLMQSSRSVATLDQLHEQKKAFHDFIREHYAALRHSDMLRQILAQYFMMHEYVNYHEAGIQAANIQQKYMQEVLNGVGSWLETLRPFIPENEVLNYCVSLYYRRSMVSLAAVIIDQFHAAAWCAGEKKEQFSFPPDLKVANLASGMSSELGKGSGQRLVAFVSEDCPVSLVETVRRARRIAEQHETTTLLVAPLEPLSPAHLSMLKMVSGGGNMLFIDEEQWRKVNLPKKIRLPLFVRINEMK